MDIHFYSSVDMVAGIYCLDFRVKHWDGCESPHPTSDGKSESFPRIGSFEQLMERFEN